MAIERGEDFYGDAGAPVETAEPEMADSDMPTTLVPKSMLMGQKPEIGDIIRLRVTGDMGEDFEVTYAEEEAEPAEEEEMMAPPPGAMEDMFA